MQGAGSQTIHWPQDSTRVNVEDGCELRFWAQRLHVSQEMLKRAVSAVGPQLGKVEAYLSAKRS
jgi:hypothetical protein